MYKNLIFLISFLFLLSLCFFGCQEDNIPSAEKSINAEALSRHIQIISSDEYEGRGPSTRGEEKTISYIRKEFEKLGLTPGNGDSFFQEVPLVSITTDQDTELVIQAGEEILSFSYRMFFTRGSTGR